MFDKEITFDRFIRGMIFILGAAGLIWLVGRLSSVLLPFFVAWLLAYMLYPLVRFVQYRLRLRNRALSIAVALLIVLGVFAGLIAIVLPPTIEEFSHLRDAISIYMSDTLAGTNIQEQIEDGPHGLRKQDQEGDHLGINESIKAAIPNMFKVLGKTANIIISIAGSLIALLYMFFILFDYEKLSNGWVRLIPADQRPFVSMVVQDVENGMNAYFRSQALIAFIVGILFSIGFLIIDFPLAIGLGLFIGLLNLVPYLQLIGFIPTILLAMLKSAETGQNFWFILLCALIVFAVVQAIQDMYLTPKIMGQAMGLNPAIILLSLSIWGSLLGFIGLIIALPLTTLCLSYYKRFILKETSETNKKS